MQGLFVTFEGPEGAGKTTAMAGVAERLKSRDQDVHLTREPGSGEIGAAIRAILLESGHVPSLCELFLFLADRSQHVELEIRPALNDGKIVLCDRFSDSTVVYQGYGRKLELSMLREFNRVSTGGLMPDLTILLDIDVRAGLERLQTKDRLDREPYEFHQQVREGFLTEAKRGEKRWFVVDATKSPDDIADEVAERILSRNLR